MVLFTSALPGVMTSVKMALHSVRIKAYSTRELSAQQKVTRA